MGRKVMMSFARQYDEFCVRDRAREMVGSLPMGRIGGAVMLIIADENERRRANVFQPIRVVVFLARKNEMKIVLQRRNARHSDL